MTTKILNEFKNSNIKIISEEKLIQYIEFCISKNQDSRIKGKTAHHHIIPKAKDCLPEYKNLRVNIWNGVHLLYSDHYYAHWLMTEAIDSYSQISAFCAMHNKDTKNGRILESELIPMSMFQKKMEERSHHQRIFMQSEAGRIGIKKQIQTKSSKEWKESIGKEAKRKEKETRSSKEWKESIGKEAKRKLKETKSSKEWKESIGKEAKLKDIFTKSNGVVFNIYRGNILLFENIVPRDIIKISKALRYATKDKPLGSSRGSKLSLNRLKKLHMIGMYVAETVIKSYRDINILDSIN